MLARAPANVLTTPGHPTFSLLLPPLQSSSKDWCSNSQPMLQEAVSPIQYNFLAAHQPSHIIPGECGLHPKWHGVGKGILPVLTSFFSSFIQTFKVPSIRLPFSVKIIIERTWIFVSRGFFYYGGRGMLSVSIGFSIFFSCFEVFSQMGRERGANRGNRGKPWWSPEYKHEQFVP